LNRKTYLFVLFSNHLIIYFWAIPFKSAEDMGGQDDFPGPFVRPPHLFQFFWPPQFSPNISEKTLNGEIAWKENMQGWVINLTLSHL
jgi:hypothetical protein